MHSRILIVSEVNKAGHLEVLKFEPSKCVNEQYKLMLFYGNLVEKEAYLENKSSSVIAHIKFTKK